VSVSGDLPEPPLQARDLLEALTRQGVDFIVIGGLAGGAHGSTYPTYDLDVAYDPMRPNLKRLARPAKLEVRLANAPPDLPFQIDAETLESGANFTFDTPHGRFRHPRPCPRGSFLCGARDHAWQSTLEGVEVRIASIDHLIAMKRAANRTKDKLMLESTSSSPTSQRRPAGKRTASAPGRPGVPSPAAIQVA